MNSVIEVIRQTVAAIEPLDDLEQTHQRETLEWIASGAPLFRTAKPATPPKHLVSYIAVFDEAKGALLLTEHIKSGLWLINGGHVEQDEDPLAAVVRETQEELGREATFAQVSPEKPLFITATVTRGQGEHTDVSLWYVIAGDATRPVDHDGTEFTSYQWLELDEILAMDIEQFDPQMHRFVRKLKRAIRP